MISFNKKIVIAVDGCSSSGKSTFARAIAKQLNYIYIDSGAMYRAIALYCLKNNIISEEKVDHARLIEALKIIVIEFKFNSKSQKYETCLNNENVEEEIRSVNVSEVVSIISKIKEVREKILTLQRKIGQGKGIVMDGRDIGTVVFPEAEIKIFMTADVDIRANRRYDELKAKNIDVDFEIIKRNIEERDYQDINRKESPLMKAHDAIELDNSDMTLAEQMDWFSKIVSEFKG
jgi:cytidylate kinase